MNHLEKLKQLQNQYFVLRHGESTANQQGLIVSSPDNGIINYGLSKTGRDQITNSVKTNQKVKKVTQIISSDFLRTNESAVIAYQLLQAKKEIHYSINLRERFFGDHELKDNSFYQAIWNDDALDSSHTINNVESADAVMERTSSLIVRLEDDFNEEVFLLVSHGDALQILQAAFGKIPPSLHRSLPHLETAEIRELVLTN